jgi:hypothetical protein
MMMQEVDSKTKDGHGGSSLGSLHQSHCKSPVAEKAVRLIFYQQIVVSLLLIHSLKQHNCSYWYSTLFCAIGEYKGRRSENFLM